MSTLLKYHLSSDDNILEMESDLLFDGFESETTFKEVQENIRAMSCGKHVFQTKTLGLAYQKLLVKKRRAIQEPLPIEAFLFCARYLLLHAYTVSELLYGLYCPGCHEFGKNGKGEYGRPFMRCGHCNALRDTGDQRCRRCNYPFIYSW